MKNNLYKSWLKILKWSIYFFILIAISTCDIDKMFPPCEPEEPLEAQLYIYLSINKENNRIPITIFEGKIEDSVIVWEDFSEEEEFWVYLPLNKYYSAMAEYKVGDKTIIAVDGDDMVTKKFDDGVDPCWEIHGGYLNCELFYDK